MTCDRLAAMVPGGRMLCVDKDQAIHAEGDPAIFCYRVLDGCVRMVKLMEDGRRQVTEFLLPGDLFGLETRDTHDLTAEAVTPTTLHRYRRAAVEALADRDPALAREWRAFAALGLRAAREQMMRLGRTSAVERIASFLLEMAARTPSVSRDRVALPMSRADIADHLGLTAETVSRVLSCMRESGMIGTGRNQAGACVSIRDLAMLQALATSASSQARLAPAPGKADHPPAPIAAARPGPAIAANLFTAAWGSARHDAPPPRARAMIGARIR